MQRITVTIFLTLGMIFTTIAAGPTKHLSPFFQRMFNDTIQTTGVNKTGFAKYSAKPTTTTAGDALYHVIIHTTNPDELRNEGITIHTVRKNFVTAEATADQVRRVAGLSSVSLIREARMRPPTNDVAAGLSGARSLQQGVVNKTKYTGKGVLICDIDTGIDWKHLDFRSTSDTAKSRIIFLWDQTLTASSSDTKVKGYGVLYTQSQLNSALTGSSTSIRSKDTVGHGTHVVGIIAGNGQSMSSKKYAGFAPEADILIVKTTFTDAAIIDAIDWADSIATALGEPLVINLSLGTVFCAHDGLEEDETVVNEISENAGRVFAISAGNSGADTIHVSGSLAASGTSTITFTVPSYTALSGTDNDYVYMDAWLSDTGNVSASLVSPKSSSGPGGGSAITVTATEESYSANNGTAGYIEVDNYKDTDHAKREIATYILDYTSAQNTPRVGTWTLTLTNKTTTAKTYHAWFISSLGSSASEVTVTNGNTSYTVGSPGNATNAITAAAYASRWYWKTYSGSLYGWSASNTSDSLAYFSSIGPRTDAVQKPDIAAPGFGVISTFPNSSISISSESAYVTPDGKHWMMAGTSMAAPCVAGSAALLLQANSSLTGSQVKSYLTDNVMTDGCTGTSLPDYHWGYGKLDVSRAMTALLAQTTVNTRKVIAYDDWSRSTSTALNRDNYVRISGSSSEKYSVRLTPSLSYGKLTGFLFHTYGTISLANSLKAEIWSNDTLTNLPSAMISGPFTIDTGMVAVGGWNYVDIPVDSSIYLVSSKSYHLVLYPSGSSDILTLMKDSVAISGRSSKYNGSSWSKLTTGDLRLRAVEIGEEAALPVQLNSFTAVSSNNSISLKWTTATETNNYGFSVESKKVGTNASWKTIGFVAGHGTSSVSHTYSYSDSSSLTAGKYLYRLGQIDQDGAIQYSSEVEVAYMVPDKFAVAQNYPNPFNPSTTITYDLASPNQTSVVVYDCLGREMATLVNGYQEAGSYKVTFDATKMASGIYFYKIVSGNHAAIKKMMLLK